MEGEREGRGREKQERREEYKRREGGGKKRRREGQPGRNMKGERGREGKREDINSSASTTKSQYKLRADITITCLTRCMFVTASSRYGWSDHLMN